MKSGSDVVFPLALSQHRWRRRIKLAIGYTAAAVMRSRVRAFEAGTARGRLSAADRLIVGALVHRALKAHQSIDHLAYLHCQLWNSDGITSYHAEAEERFDLWFLPHHSSIVDELENNLNSLPHGVFHSLCEIGVGSGLVLDYLSRRMKPHGLSRFIGLDLSAAQVSINATRFPHCDFITADACKWIPAHLAPGMIYFCCGGVLEYFPEIAVASLFSATVERSPVRWVMVEPVDAHHDFDAHEPSYPFGHEHTWTHNYKRLLVNAGLTIFSGRELEVGGVRWHMIVAGT